MMIEGWGVAVDRVISDFAQGTVEWLVEQGEARGDWVIVEGQGSLDHPAYSSVTLALIHGATPHAMVMVHKPGLADHDFDHLPEASFPIALAARRSSTSTSGSPGWWRRRGSWRSRSTRRSTRMTTRPAGSSRRPPPRRGLPADDPVRFGAGPAVAGDPRARRRAAVGRAAVSLRPGLRRSSTSRCATRSASPDRTTASGHGSPRVVVELRDDRFPGVVGVGEGYPDRFYGETPETMAAVCRCCSRRSASLRAGRPPGSLAPRAAMDGGHPRPRRGQVRARHRAPRPRRQGRSRVPVHELLGLSADLPPTDFTIGIDEPASSRERASRAAAFPALKIKVGGPGDLATLEAVRAVYRRPDPGRRQHRLDAGAARWRSCPISSASASS